ncbi:DUF488 domain-containing protein [Acetobacter thailandicus]|uniref:DUF488 domain-containing protein n=1 Tax=Acetobacter thailandicus TaxID=1502842 RepID=UPI001BA7BBF9|nr:DUF488 family protein [Acetobacter thailandicus]MBS0985868.1 DUF488 family protein [Acetobacter thailandicus]
MLPDIRLKRVYDSPSSEDGMRVFTDRLWPRGIRKADLKMDLWLKGVAPSSALRRWFGHDPAHWDEFQVKYRQELALYDPDVRQLIDLVQKERVTLLYAARDPVYNHPRVLVAFLKETIASGKDHSGV